MPRRGHVSPRWWVAVCAGIALLGVAAHGPATLPPPLAPVRALGVALFGSVDNLKTLLAAALGWHAVLGVAAFAMAPPGRRGAWGVRAAVLGTRGMLALLRELKREAHG